MLFRFAFLISWLLYLFVFLCSEAEDFLAQEQEHHQRLQAVRTIEEEIYGPIFGTLASELFAFLETGSEVHKLKEGREEDERADACKRTVVLLVLSLGVAHDKHDVPKVAQI